MVLLQFISILTILGYKKHNMNFTTEQQLYEYYGFSNINDLIDDWMTLEFNDSDGNTWNENTLKQKIKEDNPNISDWSF